MKSTLTYLVLFLIIGWLISGCSGSGSPSSQQDNGTVVVAAFDGLGDYIFRNDPAAAELTAMQSLVENGVIAQGMIPSFPSITTNTHAALYTGQFGNVNGVTVGNLKLPRSEHTILDHVSGFHSSQLRSEPVWVTAANQGIRTLAIQSTQMYPFVEHLTAADAETPPALITGYGPRVWAFPRLMTPDSTEVVTTFPDQLPTPVSELEPKYYRWNSGPVQFTAAAVSDDPDSGYNKMKVATEFAKKWTLVELHPEETQPPVNRELARFFSDDVLVYDENGNIQTVVNFRLYSLNPDGTDFELFHHAMHSVELHDASGNEEQIVQELYKAAGGFIGNGPSYLWRDGILGTQAYAGGDGTAEIRYLEGIELLIRQSNRFTEWLVDRYNPELLLDYSPYPDEVDHWYYGFVRTDITGFDEAGAEAYMKFRKWAYAALNQRAAILNEVAGNDGHIIYVADHGMTAADKEIYVNNLLRKHGLLTTDADGQVDLSQTKAYHIQASSAVIINTDDWKEGIVPLDQRDDVRDEVIEILRNFTDPETGEPIFIRFFKAEEYDEKLGTGGPSNPDLFYELASGYRHNHLLGDELVQKLEVPVGSHSHASVKKEMLSLFLAYGPHITPGLEIDRMRAVDIVYLISQLLDFNPPEGHAGTDLDIVRK